MSADDGSKAPESEAFTGDAIERFESRLDGILGYVDGLEEQLEAQAAEIESLRAELASERDRHDRERDRLQERIDALERRTDLLHLVEQADDAGPEQRSAALLQHIQRKAARLASGSRSAEQVVVDHSDATEALHHPDVDRSTIYDDMKRVVRKVGDKRVCWYRDGKLWFKPSGQQAASGRWSPTTKNSDGWVEDGYEHPPEDNHG